jgi:ATP-dependent helicase/nuclease subunit A
MTKVILDREAREKIKHDLRRNFLVEAGAGSGKTTSLVERMVNLIYSGATLIEELVAITFTRKAADELKVRFQAKLEATWKNEENLDKQFQLALAMQHMERCYLGTVHAFCAKLLRERPIEAGLDLNFKELEASDDEELLEEAWQRYLATVMEHQPERIQQLEELGVSIEQLFPWLKDLKDYPDVEWVTVKLTKPALLPEYQSFLTLLKEASKCIPEEEPDGGYDTLQKVIIQALRKDRFLNRTKGQDIFALFELFNKKLNVTQKKWSTNEDAKFYRDRVSEHFEVKIKPLLQDWKEYGHSQILEFIQEALKKYEQLKKERSLLNFQDLMLYTAKLLRENAEVRRYFQGKYRYILVDEFQDTDPLQAEIMFYLASEDLEETNWINCKPRPGSLFVVGDPKQAIYRFRRADIDTYNRVKQLIEEHNGEVLQLTMNFRTLDSVTKELNTVFERHLPEVESIYQAAYRPLNSFHEDEHRGFSGVKRLSVPADITDKEEILTRDGENIARTIKELMSQGYQAKDFMVLTRYNEGVASHSRAIEELGIKVSISGEVILGETREFQDLWILLKSFLDPTDEVAFVSVLRGLFFGFSDDELYQWKMAGGRFTLYSDVPQTLASNVKAKYELALSKLQLCQKWIRSITPTSAIEKILEEIGFYPLLLHKGLRKRAYKSLLQLLEKLRSLEAGGNTSYRKAVDALTDMIFEKIEVANLEEEADAVRVMNVHKAKGLEAKFVFLAHPVKIVNTEQYLNKHIKRDDQGSKGYYALRVPNGPFHFKDLAIPLEWENHKSEELHYLSEEELRILYVAATRAEHALIISSNGKNVKNPWKTLLDLTVIEELVVPELNPGTASLPVLDLTVQEYEAKISGKDVWLEFSKQKTYEHWAPTKDKEGIDFTIERESGGGKDWGTVVHDIVEKAVKGYDLTNYIKQNLHKYNLPLEREAEVKRYLEQLKSSPLWNELSSADEVLSEVPFSLKVEQGHSLYRLITKDPEEKQPYFVKGIIDLIYKKDDVWTIVDYKTDRAKHDEDYEKLTDYYRDQLTFYQAAWEVMTGERVDGTYLYFLEVNQLRPVE